MDEGVPMEDESAEDVLTFMDRFWLLGRWYMDRPVRAVVIIVVITLLLNAIMYATLWDYLSRAGGGDDVESLTIPDLDSFLNTVAETYYLDEGEDRTLTFEIFHAMQLPQEEGEIVICFIDLIEITIIWYDEPGNNVGPVTWDNQPDTVGVTLNEWDYSVFEEMDEASNEPGGGGGEVMVSWYGDGEYLEQSWLNEGDLTFSGIDGGSYVATSGGHVYWNCYPDGTVWMVEAGDQTHDILPLMYPDDGNEVIVEVTIGGYFHELPPGSYDEIVRS
jgi:hypothetical protein